ncbi:hypothetical protein [Tenacibaculum xiamenense]|uniref:hypothetical protein n=1 Tax=Tenacibaculum xiamenense TaxID=1261553 RepID=UPI00389571B2
METIKPQQNQNILDISLQKYGTIEKVFDIVEQNGYETVTHEVSEYESIELPVSNVKQDIVNYYETSGIYPATKHTVPEINLILQERKEKP